MKQGRPPHELEQLARGEHGNPHAILGPAPARATA